MGLTALILAATLQQQPQISERVVRELVRLGAQDDYSSRNYADHLRMQGREDLARFVLTEMKPLPPYLEGIKINDSMSYNDLRNFQKSTPPKSVVELPPVIKKALSETSDGSVDKAVRYIRNEEAQRRNINILGGLPIVQIGSMRPTVEFCLALLFYGEYDQFLRISKQYLKPVELEEHATSFKVIAEMSPEGAIKTLYRFALNIYSVDELYMKSYTTTHADFKTVLIDAVMRIQPAEVPDFFVHGAYRTAPLTDLGRSSEEYKQYTQRAFTLYSFITQLVRDGEAGTALEILERHWDQITMVSLFNGQSAQVDDFNFLIDLGRSDLMIKLAERTQEEYELLLNESAERRVIQSRWLLNSAAIQFYINAGQEEKALPLMSERRLVVYKANKLLEEGEPEKALDQYIDNGEYIDARTLRSFIKAGNDESARRMLRKSISGELLLIINLNQSFLYRELVARDMKDEIRTILHQLEKKDDDKYGLISLKMGYLSAAINEDDAAMQHLKKFQDNLSSSYEYWVNWKLETGREFKDFLEIGGDQIIEDWFVKDILLYANETEIDYPAKSFLRELVALTTADSQLFEMSLSYIKRLIEATNSELVSKIEFDVLYLISGNESERLGFTRSHQEQILDLIIELRESRSIN